MREQVQNASGRQVLRVEDMDQELLDQIMNAKWGTAVVAVKDQRDARIEKLEDLLYDIALMADNHKASRLYVEGENVALVNIRNMASMAIAKGHIL